jgi:hypothetical protein
MFPNTNLFYSEVRVFLLLLSNIVIIAPTMRVIMPTINKITPAVIPLRGCRLT